MSTKQDLEKKYNCTLTRGWILDGIGNARFGWGKVHPGKIQWLGRTLIDAEKAL